MKNRRLGVPGAAGTAPPAVRPSGAPRELVGVDEVLGAAGLVAVAAQGPGLGVGPQVGEGVEGDAAALPLAGVVEVRLALGGLGA